MMLGVFLLPVKIAVNNSGVGVSVQKTLAQTTLSIDQQLVILENSTSLTPYQKCIVRAMINHPILSRIPQWNVFNAATCSKTVKAVATATISGALGIPTLVMAFIFWLIRAIVGWLATISARLLDYSIVVAIGFDYTTAVSGITKVWTLIRDLCNISLVFILLYAGIMQIIGFAKANTKQIIINVVIVGLFLNFSLFFTRVAIDASNIVSTALYNQIVTISGSTNFSASLIDGLGISAVLSNNTISTSDLGNLNLVSAITNISVIISFVPQIILFSIILWAFLSVAFLFIGRVVMVIILMAISPIGFIGLAIGHLSKELEDASIWWRKQLLNQMFVIPIFLVFLIIIMSLCSVAGKIALSSDVILSALKSGTLDFSAYLIFFILIFLLTKAVSIAKKTSGAVAEFGNGMVGKLGGMVVGAGLTVATGGGAFLAKSTIGRAASTIASGKGRIGGMLNKAANNGNTLAQWTIGGAKKTAGAGFDVRNTAGGAWFNKTTGINANTNILGTGIGQAQKGGFTDAQKKYNEQQVEYAKRASQLTDADKDKATAKVEETRINLGGDIQTLTQKLTGLATDKTRLEAEKASKETDKTNIETLIAGLKAHDGDIDFKTGKKIDNTAAIKQKEDEMKLKEAEIKQKSAEIDEKISDIKTKTAEKKKKEDEYTKINSVDGHREAQEKEEKTISKEKMRNYADNVENGQNASRISLKTGFVSRSQMSATAEGIRKAIGEKSLTELIGEKAIEDEKKKQAALGSSPAPTPVPPTPVRPVTPPPSPRPTPTTHSVPPTH